MRDKYLDLAGELKKIIAIAILIGAFVTVRKGKKNGKMRGRIEITQTTALLRGGPRGVMVKVLDCGIVLSEFELQSRYYVYFQTNTLGKGMSLLILPPIG